jgi:hypothetical protein
MTRFEEMSSLKVTALVALISVSIIAETMGEFSYTYWIHFFGNFMREAAHLFHRRSGALGAMADGQDTAWRED